MKQRAPTLWLACSVSKWGLVIKRSSHSPPELVLIISAALCSGLLISSSVAFNLLLNPFTK